MTVLIPYKCKDARLVIFKVYLSFTIVKSKKKRQLELIAKEKEIFDRSIAMIDVGWIG